MLAGISADYYLRLEQGREAHPSPAVLEGLVRALALDADGAAYLYRLTRPVASTPRPETVSPSLIGLITSIPSTPAHVVDRFLTILHVNPLAELLSPGFRVGNNLVELVFHPDLPRDASWATTARRAVASLRASVDPHDSGPEITALLTRLRAADPAFGPLWDRHEARTPAGHPATFGHPQYGTIELRYQTFDLPGTGGQALGMYVPTPGSSSAEKLQMLSLLVGAPTAESVRVAPRKTRGTPAV